MSHAFETVKIESKNIACDGEKGALGHPKVYLEMGVNDEITCPYCSRHFVYEPKSKAS